MEAKFSNESRNSRRKLKFPTEAEIPNRICRARLRGDVLLQEISVLISVISVVISRVGVMISVRISGISVKTS